MAPTVAKSKRAGLWRLRERVLDLSQPRAAGIVNVTDDSMFSGARSVTSDQAIADGLALEAAGFDLLDVGAVAARSGPAVSPEAEAAKLIPAVEGLVAGASVPVSVDTFSPGIARLGVAAGAEIVNDIGGGSAEMLAAVAELGCGYVLMHIEGPPRVDRERPSYGDVVAHLGEWFGARLDVARREGVDSARVAIDPGLDFDLGLEDDLEILRRLGELHALGCPLYISLSRKDFLGAVLAGSWEDRLPPEQREWATAAATALAVGEGAQVLRLHDTTALDAMRVAGRIVNG